MKTERNDHDRWFKELITTFFEEFILAFIPEAYEHLDFDHLTFLQQEVYTDILKGRKGTVDILAETKLRGQDALIIVHIEPQSYYESDFNDRMFFYFSRLYEKYRRPILPIAIFSYDQPRKENDYFNVHFTFKKVLSFNFFSIHLKNKNWRDFIHQPTPVALALLGKMGYDQREKVIIKIQFLRMLLNLELDPARQQLVAGIFENYFKLSKDEESQLHGQLKHIPKDEVNHIMELMTSWERKGIEKGKMEGKIEEKNAIARRMLQKGFCIQEIIDITGLSEKEIKELKI
ncbi:Rpn family recombination-promoting nuclease/putative transposase [Alkalihalobacillus sp. BA299]|uniref:Rpn family recombination-promoting nuclease/putative transposase n=1 Tax=Alkalihalobacillus sp. BA299 TaxID=2815938 RepID=UPI001ADC80E3|nr:Rpn family recombination-promoting nuclease/putative transposase [Alkalihalobacillus sp. BA299]